MGQIFVLLSGKRPKNKQVTQSPHIGPLDGVALAVLAFLVLSPSLVACGLVGPKWLLIWTAFPWPHLFAFLLVTLVRGLVLRVVPRAALSFRLPPGRWVPCIGLLAALGLLFWGSQGARCSGTLFPATPPTLPEFLAQPLIGFVTTPLVLILSWIFWVLVTGRPLGPKRRRNAP